MEAIEKKMNDLMEMHDWLFPADKLEKQVTCKSAHIICNICVSESALNSFAGSPASCHC